MFGLGLAIKARLYIFIKKSKSDLFKKNINVLLVLLCGCFCQKTQHSYTKGSVGLLFLYNFFIFFRIIFVDRLKQKLCARACV